VSNFSRRHPFKNLAASAQYQIKWELQYQALLIKFLKKHLQFDGSMVSHWMRQQGLHDPLHHNYWPTQIAYYAAQGWFTKIGHVSPKGPQAHIEQVSLWESKLHRKATNRIVVKI
jgi:hypothetical protein